MVAAPRARGPARRRRSRRPRPAGGSRASSDCRWARCDRLRCRRSRPLAPTEAGGGAAGRALRTARRAGASLPRSQWRPEPGSRRWRRRGAFGSHRRRHRWSHRAPPPRRSLRASASDTARSPALAAKRAAPGRRDRCRRSGCRSAIDGQRAHVGLSVLKKTLPLPSGVTRWISPGSPVATKRSPLVSNAIAQMYFALGS